MPLVADLIDELESIAPPDLADEDDHVGLQVGDPSAQVSRICVSVDTSAPVIDAAIAAGADLLVAHHPLIYKPLQAVVPADPVAARVMKLISSNTALFVMHTNFDTAPGGINDALAGRLGVLDASPLTDRKQDKLYKIAVFVPQEAAEQVRNAMAEAGAGRIGQYSHCSFRTVGTGSFVPLPAAQPYIGTTGKLEEVEEIRLEMVCAGSLLDWVLAEMLEKHPYDEVAYDLYELANEPLIYGYGRVGTLDSPITLAEFAERAKSALEVRFPKVFGDLGKRISRVALLGGGGSRFYREAVAARADVFVTGDTRHHDILDALDAGIAIVDAGHFETEKPGMVALVERLRNTFAGSGMDIDYVEAWRASLACQNR